MAFNWTTGIYTPPNGATNAFAGQIIASAVWNTIHTDLSSALTQLGEFFVPRTVSGSFTLLQFDSLVMITGSAPTVTLPLSANKTGPVKLIGAASGIFSTNHAVVLLSGSDALDGSTVSPALTLTVNYQVVTFYPLPSGGYVFSTP